MKKKILGLFFLVLLLARPLFGEEVSYDRYGAEPSQGTKHSRIWGRLLVYPFELLRWPIDQSLVYVEKRHLYDKGYWIYEQMKNRGLKPRFLKGAAWGDSFGGGVNLDLMKLSTLKETLPQLAVEGSAAWTLDKITLYQAKILKDQTIGTAFRTGVDFKYAKRAEEHFYGIGPHTSRGDGTSYKSERTTLDAILGYSFLNTWDLEGKFSYQNVNITNGEDEGRGVIDPIFVATGRQSIPGLAGDRILSWALELKHDNRDELEIPSKGGYEKFHLSFHKGLENDTGYFKYRADIAHFFKFFSERQVIGLRGLVESNDEICQREVPFFDMARLGGYGTYPRLGETHRGYARDRFYDENLLLFNLEYRWTIWEYRHWRMDSVLFWDEGQVFGEWSHFKLNDLRASYGLGFRVSRMKEVVLTFEIARSNEGMEFYVGTAAPF